MEAVFLTALTTVIGFLSMNFSDTPPLRDLGNIAALGIIAAFFFTVFTLPAAAILLPFRAKKVGIRYISLFRSLGDFVVERQRILLVSMVVVVLVLVSFVPRLELNDQYVNYFDRSSEFRRDTDFAMQHLTGIYKIEYLIRAGEKGGVNNPEYLKVLQAFGEWYRGQPEVVHVHSIVETMKTLNMSLHGDNSIYFRLPDNRELAAQYLLLYEMSLPYGLDMNSEVSIGKDATRFTVMLKNISTKELLRLEESAQDWLRVNAPTAMVSDGTGSSIIFSHMSERSIRSMIGGTVLAIILIGLVLMVALKSIKYGVLSFIPNLLPAIMALGVWAIFVGELGFALSVMIAMTLGIVVDDTIHFFTKYLRGRQTQQLSPADAVRYAFSTVGIALLTTTIVLVLGFLVLAQSSFLPNSGMAMLTVITISIALAIDFFLIPPMLLVLDDAERSQ
jgi:predicted RND superfamily exporter protein